MKKQGILNSDISRVLSYMGHTDMICVGDAGLPTPEDVERIDLAVKLGLPGFMDTMTAVTDDMKVEKIYLASEIKEMNPDIHQKILDHFKEQEITPEIEYMSHEDFKELTEDCKAVIRTGENTPYANIILQSACVF